MRREKYFSVSKEREIDLRRGPKNGERKTYTVQKMWQRHHEIVRLHCLGLKNTSIAKKLDITPAVVSYTLNSPIVQDRIKMMNGALDAETMDMKKKLDQLAVIALELEEEIITGRDFPIQVRQRSAHSILDRHPETTKRRSIDGEIRHAHAHFTAEEIEEIKERGRRAAEQSGQLFIEELVNGEVEMEILQEG